MFHEACFLTWLEEGLEPAGALGGIEKVPIEMRKNVVAAGCETCLMMRDKVGLTGLSIEQIEQIVEEGKGRKGWDNWW